MKINVVYFASLRETLGKHKQELTLEPGATVADLMSNVFGSTGVGQVLSAVNHEYSPVTHQLKDGDTVALFPPVTGG